jgi:hypothetical protein
MSYTHTNAKPVTLKNDPVDPDSTDWIYFSYGNWLTAGETISAHSATASGGTIVTDSTYLGTMADSDGVSHDDVYGVKFSVASGATQVTITHRVSTTTSGAVDLGRTDIDHSALMAVKSL